MVHLKSISIEIGRDYDYYPFNLPLLKNLKELHFTKPITIFVGDNGTGKSTLLEAIATNIGSPSICMESMDFQPSLNSPRELAKKLKLTWKVKTKTGFYFRANDFIKFIENISKIREESKEAIKEIRDRDQTSLEVLPYARTLGDLKYLYGDGLDVQSHGESFLALFSARFKPHGLYILDEPESPLSPLKQLSLISMINNMVKQQGQFIIATHSPMLMAIPSADIYYIEDGKISLVNYEDVEHVRLTKDFLNNPKNFLRHLE